MEIESDWAWHIQGIHSCTELHPGPPYLLLINQKKEIVNPVVSDWIEAVTDSVLPLLSCSCWTCCSNTAWLLGLISGDLMEAQNQRKDSGL